MVLKNAKRKEKKYINENIDDNIINKKDDLLIEENIEEKKEIDMIQKTNNKDYSEDEEVMNEI